MAWARHAGPQVLLGERRRETDRRAELPGGWCRTTRGTSGLPAGASTGLLTDVVANPALPPNKIGSTSRSSQAGTPCGRAYRARSPPSTATSTAVRRTCRTRPHKSGPRHHPPSRGRRASGCLLIGTSSGRHSSLTPECRRPRSGRPSANCPAPPRSCGAKSPKLSSRRCHQANDQRKSPCACDLATPAMQVRSTPRRHRRSLATACSMTRGSNACPPRTTSSPTKGTRHARRKWRPRSCKDRRPRARPART
mmetsp:Transcript_113523/g.327825  ORF Transcript_113523/g.327825 Transcript_113523/m.327825 type:complete len:252 (-) Transcript_113523:1136-1891(-)